MSRWISIEKISNQSKYKEPLKNEKSEDYCKADSEQRVLFFHEQYFGWPYQPFSGLHPDVTDLMKHNITDIDGEYRNENCIKGIGGHDVQHRKLEKKKINKDMDYKDLSRRLRPLGSRVMALSVYQMQLSSLTS